MDRLKEFVKERNEALFSLDKGRIMDYARKHGIRMPEDETVFWAGVYKALIHITDTPPELRGHAIAWLARHGYSTAV